MIENKLPEPRTRVEHYLNAMAEGKTQKDPFIITLTPTAEDYSGTMDKTCGEITDAYNSGRPIWFNFDVASQGFTELSVPATQITRADHLDGRVCAQCFVFNLPNEYVWVATADNTDDSSNYFTRVFSLEQAPLT